MKILHLSDTPLPDWRVEKSASSSKKRGDLVYFCGPIASKSKFNFEKVYGISWTSHARNKLPYYWNMVKKQMTKTIKEVKPDVIHAHNIFSAKMATEIGDYPLVYDDHEYWSMYAKIKTEAFSHYRKSLKTGYLNTKGLAKKFIVDFLNNKFVRTWSKAEHELIVNNPTITVSNTILKDFKRIGKQIFLVPNFPTFKEIENIREPIYHEKLSSVYAGIQLTNPIKSLHMNLDGFFNLFETSEIGKLNVLGWNKKSTDNVVYHGYLNRNQMYDEMFKNSIGLIPFKKHWFHPYSSPNKAYEYAHAGLYATLTSDLTSVTENLKEHCILFDNYDELVANLQNLSNNLDDLYSKRLKTYQYARSNLLWENFEKNIFESYKVC
jgi:glycosyltransferase involved in cell wall biosynthesis